MGKFSSFLKFLLFLLIFILLYCVISNLSYETKILLLIIENFLLLFLLIIPRFISAFGGYRLLRYFERRKVDEMNGCLDSCFFKITNDEFKYYILPASENYLLTLYNDIDYIRHQSYSKDYTKSCVLTLNDTYSKYDHKSYSKYIVVLKDGWIREIIYIDYSNIESTIAEIDSVEYEINAIDKWLEKNTFYTKNNIDKEKGN